MNTTLDAVMQAVKALPLNDRRRLKEWIAAEPAPPSVPDAEATAELDRRLLAAGIISSIPRALTSEEAAAFEAWHPLPFNGKPLSHTILEERR